MGGGKIFVGFVEIFVGFGIGWIEYDIVQGLVYLQVLGIYFLIVLIECFDFVDESVELGGCGVQVIVGNGNCCDEGCYD